SVWRRPVAFWLAAWRALRGPWPAASRQPASPRSSIRAYGRLFSDPMFLVMAGVAGLMFATLFAYVAGAPFLLQGRDGRSPQAFGLVFSANAVGLILMTQLNPVLVGRFGPVRVISVGVLGGFTGGVVL